MKMVVRLGTCVDADREESAELAAMGRKRREREEKGKGRKVEEDVVEDFRLGTSLKVSSNSQMCVCSSQRPNWLWLRGVIEGRSCERKKGETRRENWRWRWLSFIMWSNSTLSHEGLKKRKGREKKSLRRKVDSEKLDFPPPSPATCR